MVRLLPFVVFVSGTDSAGQIVGGGVSGLTVAKRLLETPGVSLAVIEAGNFYEYDNNNVTQIPAYHTVNSNADRDPANIQPLIDWGQLTTPQLVHLPSV